MAIKFSVQSGHRFLSHGFLPGNAFRIEKLAATFQSMKNEVVNILTNARPYMDDNQEWSVNV